MLSYLSRGKSFLYSILVPGLCQHRNLKLQILNSPNLKGPTWAILAYVYNPLFSMIAGLGYLSIEGIRFVTSLLLA